MQLKDLVCNANMLKQFLTVDGGEATMNDLQTQLCNLPADILQEAEHRFLSQLDFTKFFTVGINNQGKAYTNKPVRHCRFIGFTFSVPLLRPDIEFLVYLLSCRMSTSVNVSVPPDRETVSWLTLETSGSSVRL